MASAFIARCDCCGTLIKGEQGPDCPRCGYPIERNKEEQFLRLSIESLQRVAAYGGAHMTVSQLITRYQQRLRYLLQFDHAAANADTAAPATAPTPVPTTGAESEQPAIPTEIQVPIVQAVSSSSVQPSGTATPAPQSPARPERVFSFRTFFADQTINIVATLGAFLILAGSLSFIATSSNNLVSFLVLLLVHVLFGAIGGLTFRFRSIRTVSVIYTGIFVLQVPLVGFAGYRFVTDNIVPLSAPTVLALAALYAAIVYGALAVYQRFDPFAYLAVVALAVADLAIGLIFHLDIYWWPALLLLLAFPALLSVSGLAAPPRVFGGPQAILRVPLRWLMVVCVFSNVLAITIVAFACINDAFVPFVLNPKAASGAEPLSQMRWSLVVMTFLLPAWICLYALRVRQTRWLLNVPYLFLSFVLACCYLFASPAIAYALACTGVAVLYHGSNRFVPGVVGHVKDLGRHLEGLALALVAAVPLIVAPLLPFQMLWYAYTLQPLSQYDPFALADIALLLLGCILTVSVVVQHTGRRKNPVGEMARWSWWLLLSGVLLNWAYGIALATLNVEPVWGWLGFLLLLSAGAVVVRRLSGTVWAQPLDVLALIAIVQTLLLSLLNLDLTCVLLLSFAALMYGVLYYQRRSRWLWLVLLLALFALPHLLFVRAENVLWLSIALPLCAAGIVRFVARRPSRMRLEDGLVHSVSWVWPVLWSGFLYGLCFVLYGDAARAVSSTLHAWLGISVPVSLELTLLALAWYGAAVLAQEKLWLIVTFLFGVAALLSPINSFWTLLVLAPLLLVLAWAIARLAGRDWAWPLYVWSLLSTVMMGLVAYSQQHVYEATWALLGLALLLYLLGIIERKHWSGLILMWLAVPFASWSVYNAAAVLGDLYRAPLMALLCAVLGVGIGSLRFVFPSLATAAWRKQLLAWAMPFYATALLAAVLTGIYGTLAGVNHPFFAAIPIALFVYALVAYGIALFERRPRVLVLVAGFAVWCAFLLPRASICFPLRIPCAANIPTTLYALVALALLSGVLGLCIGRVRAAQADPRFLFLWNWPWYLSAIVAMGVTFGWDVGAPHLLPQGPVLTVFVLFFLLALLLMVVERVPEGMVLVVALALWAIARTAWPLWQILGAYSLLCVLVFGAQFIWSILSPVTRLLLPKRLYTFVSLCGSVVIIVVIMFYGGLSVQAGMLAHVGAASLFLLALLLFWAGRVQHSSAIQRFCTYGAGLLFALTISWETVAFRVTEPAILALAPASYLITVAPFLARDEAIAKYRSLGQFCAMLGALLLLLPALWSSFGPHDLTMTLLLSAEALVLLILGVGTRLRFFVLSGAAVVIVSAIHLLFLPSLGIPTFLALTLVGVLLLAIATLLIAIRSRLAAFWSEMA